MACCVNEEIAQNEVLHYLNSKMKLKQFFALMQLICYFAYYLAYDHNGTCDVYELSSPNISGRHFFALAISLFVRLLSNLVRISQVKLLSVKTEFDRVFGLQFILNKTYKKILQHSILSMFL
jgi:hypothetical protein